MSIFDHRTDRNDHFLSSFQESNDDCQKNSILFPKHNDGLDQDISYDSNQSKENCLHFTTFDEKLVGRSCKTTYEGGDQNFIVNSDVSGRNNTLPIREDQVSDRKDKIRKLMDERAKRFWSKKEDSQLLSFIQEKSNKNWKLISDFIKSKTPQQCAYRYGKLMADLNKKKWTRKDDIKLLDLIEVYGFNWKRLAQFYEDRNDVDLEFRYREKLNPNISNEEFTAKEDKLIIKLHQEYGNKWFEISRHFPNRTSKMIKRRFQNFLRNTEKSKTKSKPASESLKEDVPNSNDLSSLQNSKMNYGLAMPDRILHHAEMVIDSNLQAKEEAISNNNLDIISHNNYSSNLSHNHLGNRMEEIINIFDKQNSNAFDVDLFFDCGQLNDGNYHNTALSHREKVADGNQTYLKLQLSKVDDYFNNLVRSFNLKSKNSSFEEIEGHHPLYLEMRCIDSQIRGLISQATKCKSESDKAVTKEQIIEYIELVAALVRKLRERIKTENLIHGRVDLVPH